MRCLRRHLLGRHSLRKIPAKFHRRSGFTRRLAFDESAITQVQAAVRKRILRAFVARGHLEAHEAKDMAAYALGAVQSGPK